MSFVVNYFASSFPLVTFLPVLSFPRYSPRTHTAAVGENGPQRRLWLTGLSSRPPSPPCCCIRIWVPLGNGAGGGGGWGGRWRKRKTTRGPMTAICFTLWGVNLCAAPQQLNIHGCGRPCVSNIGDNVTMECHYGVYLNLHNPAHCVCCRARRILKNNYFRI